MRALKRPFEGRDPAPSRLAFRLKRLWRSEGFRRTVAMRAPAALALGICVWVGAQPELRAQGADLWRAAVAKIAERPEFAIRRIEVRGAAPGVTREIEAALAPWRGASSLAADAGAIRDATLAIGWVERATVRLSAPETLIVQVRERRPALLWRHDGALRLIDAGGAVLAEVAARGEWPEMPLVAGAGADAAAGEALRIFAAAAGLGPRIRGLVRVGERRWDVILHQGPTVMLPAAGAVDAMGYLAALDAGEAATRREVATIDLRLAGRPTIRLTPEAAEARARAKAPKKPGTNA